MKRIWILVCICVFLSGCSLMNGSYVSVEPHKMPHRTDQSGVIAASDYLQLMAAMEEFIIAGTESAVINIADYPTSSVDSGMAVAIRYATEDYPLGAYAVEEISYEYGTSGGQPALAVSIHYRHSLAEILQIRQVETIEEAEHAVMEALNNFSASVVMYVQDYISRDFTQLVQDYALENPHLVMELPQVTEGIYGNGSSKVVELIFTYQNGRDVLRQMKNQVKPVFSAAELYVSGEGADRQKFSQLYGFLMERFDYTVETSITPAYSLLHDGVGDSRAFATVYAAMCRAAGLECSIITGSRAGQPRTWNLVRDNGLYYHVDLLRSSEQGIYREFTDGEMQGYVWDYSAYPACTGSAAVTERVPTPAETEPTAPAEETAEQTIPDGTEKIFEEF